MSKLEDIESFLVALGWFFFGYVLAFFIQTWLHI
jgi:hypothetical protein